MNITDLSLPETNYEATITLTAGQTIAFRWTMQAFKPASSGPLNAQATFNAPEDSIVLQVVQTTETLEDVENTVTVRDLAGNVLSTITPVTENYTAGIYRNHYEIPLAAYDGDKIYIKIRREIGGIFLEEFDSIIYTVTSDEECLSRTLLLTWENTYTLKGDTVDPTINYEHEDLINSLRVQGDLRWIGSPARAHSVYKNSAGVHDVFYSEIESIYELNIYRSPEWVHSIVSYATMHETITAQKWRIIGSYIYPVSDFDKPLTLIRVDDYSVSETAVAPGGDIYGGSCRLKEKEQGIRTSKMQLV